MAGYVNLVTKITDFFVIFFENVDMLPCPKSSWDDKNANIFLQLYLKKKLALDSNFKMVTDSKWTGLVGLRKYQTKVLFSPDVKGYTKENLSPESERVKYLVNVIL